MGSWMQRLKELQRQAEEKAKRDAAAAKAKSGEKRNPPNNTTTPETTETHNPPSNTTVPEKTKTTPEIVTGGSGSGGPMKSVPEKKQEKRYPPNNSTFKTSPWIHKNLEK